MPHKPPQNALNIRSRPSRKLILGHIGYNSVPPKSTAALRRYAPGTNIEYKMDSSKEYYDPDQDQDERRALRKGMRELAKELNGMRLEVGQGD